MFSLDTLGSSTDPAKKLGWKHSARLFDKARDAYGAHVSSAACVEYMLNLFDGNMSRGLMRHNYWAAWYTLLAQVSDVSKVTPAQMLDLLRAASTNSLTTPAEVRGAAVQACKAAMGFRSALEAEPDGTCDSYGAKTKHDLSTPAQVLDTLCVMLAGCHPWEFKRLDHYAMDLPMHVLCLLITYFQDTSYGSALAWRAMEFHASRHMLDASTFKYTLAHLEHVAGSNRIVENLSVFMSVFQRLLYHPSTKRPSDLFSTVQAIRPDDLPRSVVKEIKSWRVAGLRAAFNPSSLLFTVPRGRAGAGAGAGVGGADRYSEDGYSVTSDEGSDDDGLRASPHVGLPPTATLGSPKLWSRLGMPGPPSAKVIAAAAARREQVRAAVRSHSPAPPTREAMTRSPALAPARDPTAADTWREEDTQATGSKLDEETVVPPEEGGEEGTVVTTVNDDTQAELVQFKVNGVSNLLPGECKVSNLFPVRGVQCRLIVYPAGTAADPEALGVFLAVDYLHAQAVLSQVRVTDAGVQFPGYVGITLLHPRDDTMDVEKRLTKPIQFGQSVGFEALATLSDMKVYGYQSVANNGSITVGVVTYDLTETPARSKKGKKKSKGKKATRRSKSRSRRSRSRSRARRRSSSATSATSATSRGATDFTFDVSDFTTTLTSSTAT